MNFFSNLFGFNKKPAVSVTKQGMSFMPAFSMYGSGTSLNPSVLYSEGYLKNLYVKRCIDYIASSSASIEVEAYKAEKQLKTSPLLDFINQPNSIQTWKEFIREAVIQLLIKELYIELILDSNKRPTAMYVIPNTNMSVYTDNIYYPSYVTRQDNTGSYKYEYSRATGSFVKRESLIERHVIRIFDSNGRDRWSAFSQLESVMQSVINYNKALEWNTTMLANGANPMVVASISHQLPADQLEILTESFYNRLSGSNKGKPILFDGDMKVERLGFTPEEMSYLELLKTMAQDISNGFNVPLALLFNDASTFNNTGNGEGRFYSDNVIPMLSRILDAMNKLLSPLFGGHAVRINQESISSLNEDRNKKTQTLVLLLRAGVLSPEQVAVELGYEYKPDKKVDTPLGIRVNKKTEEDVSESGENSQENQSEEKNNDIVENK
jgi:HK97 family phage portal protein